MEGQGLIYNKFVILQPFDVNSLAHESILNISSRKFHKLIVKLRIRSGFLKKIASPKSVIVAPNSAPNFDLKVFFSS